MPPSLEEFIGWCAAVVVVLLLVGAARKASYRQGVRDGYLAHKEPDSPAWDPQRQIMRNEGEAVRLTTEFVRGPADEECRLYKVGIPAREAECETDGHYLCEGCVWNVHRRPNHECKGGYCKHPELRRADA